MTSASKKECSSLPTQSFCVTYSAKDSILFALAIGFGASQEHYDQDLRYLYEDHERFEVVPLWGLALPFWAYCNEQKPLLPLFPPPVMSYMGVIPRSHLRGDNIHLDDFPVLHMFQSIVWHDPFPQASKDTTTTLQLQPSFQSIQPKSIGTFVTTESTVVHETSLICSIQTTVLILGLPSEHVIPFSNGGSSTQNLIPMNHTEMGNVWFEKVYSIDSNVALLYRLASGDTNYIHVRPVIGEKPILHGLFTLAIAATSILQKRPQCTPTTLHGNFTKPIFLNDIIVVKVWKRNDLEFNFIVYNQTRDEICVDKGYLSMKQWDSACRHSRL